MFNSSPYHAASIGSIIFSTSAIPYVCSMSLMPVHSTHLVRLHYTHHPQPSNCPTIHQKANNHNNHQHGLSTYWVSGMMLCLCLIPHQIPVLLLFLFYLLRKMLPEWAWNRLEGLKEELLSGEHHLYTDESYYKQFQNWLLLLSSRATFWTSFMTFPFE